MEFRKMVMITLYVRQQKRHRCIEQSFGLCGRGRGRWFGRMALKHVWYHIRNESPIQVWCRIQDTGMTQRDGMGREVGGGFRMGNTCTPVADSCWCMAKPIQYCKVISLQLKKINFIFKKKLCFLLLKFFSFCLPFPLICKMYCFLINMVYYLSMSPFISINVCYLHFEIHF